MEVLYVIYQICIAIPLFVVATVVAALVTAIGVALFGSHFWGYWPAKLWARFICVILLLPVKVEGREKIKKNTSYVFVANHQSIFDIPLVYGYLGRNFKWMMKKSLRKLPVIGKACEICGHIFVDRSGPHKIYQTIANAKAVLHDGVSVFVFPEGARTFTGHMGYFKRGAFQLADDLQLDVVPVTLDGPFQILPRNGRFIHWHRLRLTIHDPIPYEGKGPEHIRHTMDLAYRAVESAMPPEFQGMVRNDDQEVF